MDLIKRCLVKPGSKLHLKDHDPGDTFGVRRNDAALEKRLDRLRELQQLLYADKRYALLIVLQALDAGGKDGTIRHVMSGVNPQGVQVTGFKVPSAEELDHDFLWRVARHLPARGDIGIFNRSHYEEVLVVRVHKEFLQKQKVPKELVGKDVWKDRFKSIRAFERHLAQNGTVVLKFFLHISKEEQRHRFLARLEQPAKRWKFSMGDVAERKLWDKYMAAYEDMVRATSRPHAPWYIVPANNKPFARLVVAKAMIEALEKLDLKFPKVDPAALKEMEKVRKALLAEE